MNTPAEEQLDLESRIHALICGSPRAGDREQILARIATDDASRQLLAEMLEVQRAARAAFNYDLADASMGASLARLDASLHAVAGTGQRASASRLGGATRRFARQAYLWRAAAAVAIVASAYVALTAHRTARTIQEQLARHQGEPDSAGVVLTEADLTQCRLAWKQVSGNANTWVLLADGEGQFGSILADAQSAPAVTRVLLMHLSILDGSGRCVGKTTLLMPDKRTLDLKLPDFGSVGGQPASLAVARWGDDTIINLSVGEREGVPVGVTARMPAGATDQEAGSFRLRDQRLRLFVKTEALQTL